jgi:hypothetical protein
MSILKNMRNAIIASASTCSLEDLNQIVKNVIGAATNTLSVKTK